MMFLGVDMRLCISNIAPDVEEILKERCTFHGSQSHFVQEAIRAYAHKEKPVKKRGTTQAFIPPTPEEAAEYFFERGSLQSAEDAEAFIDHFTSNGWKVGGKTKMKDWKSSIRNWMRRSKKDEGKKSFISKRDVQKAEVQRHFDDPKYALDNW